MLEAARQGLDELLHREVFTRADFIGAVFVGAASRRPQLQFLSVYRELAVVHLDAVAGQADHAFDVGYAGLARQAEYGHVADFRQPA